MAQIEHIPTDPPGEISLELQDGTVIVERALYGAQAGPGVPAERDRKTRIHVPVASLGQLILLSPGFRFENLTFDEVRIGLDFARAHGWPR